MEHKSDKSDIDLWVDQVLNSHQRMVRSQPSETIFSLIEEKIYNSSDIISMKWMYRVAAVASFLILINIISIRSYSNQKKISAKASAHSFDLVSQYNIYN